MSNMPMRKFIVRILIIIVIVVVSILVISGYIAVVENPNILEEITTEEQLNDDAKKALTELEPQCIIVLGAAVMDKETPTDILKARLDVATMLYEDGIAPKILLTGDGEKMYYDEADTMLNYLLDKGVMPEDVFCDRHGLNTYYSMVRASNLYNVQRAVVVTQGFHLPRALYIGEQANVKLYGIASNQVAPSLYNEDGFLLLVRETLARNKDFFKLKFKDFPEYDEEGLNILGNGQVTHDN